MEIKSYDDINVELLRSTDNPKEIIGLAASMTQKKDFRNMLEDLENLIKKLLKMNHTGLFEHINYSFLIEGASRNFLAQVTRHRMGSFTSASQHYQNQKGYGIRLNQQVANYAGVKHISTCIEELYQKMLTDGIPKEEARMILPGGLENNLLWTINARSLINYFNLRLCERNVEEMKIVTYKVYNLAYSHFPDLFKYVGPDCFIKGKCSQGLMKCKSGYQK